MSIRYLDAEAADLLKNIEEGVSDDSNNFHSFFRKRGLSLQRLFNKGLLDTQTALAYIPEIQIDEEFYDVVRQNVPILKRKFLSILLSKKSSKILWRLHCMPSKTSFTLLTEIVPALEAIAEVIRGGHNIYKLNGWVVHVLIGYSILTEYIPASKLPPTISWDREVRNFVSDVLRNKYRSLGKISQAILHVAMLCHDIGVSVSVEDHDRHGVALLPECLKEINITNESLRDNHINITLPEFVWRLKIVVRLHTFINRLGIEYSLKKSKMVINKIFLEEFNNQDRSSFIKDDLPAILLLVGVADLVAVDDKLFDSRMVRELTKGYETLLSLMCEADSPVDQVNGGYERFISFLGGKNSRPNRIEFENALTRFGYTADLFWTKFYNLEEVNFALSLLPFLPEAHDTLLSFLLLFSFIDLYCGTDIATYESTTVVFDHNLQPGSLMAVINQLKLQDINEYQLYMESDGWRKEGLNIQLTINDTANRIFIRMEKPNR